MTSQIKENIKAVGYGLMMALVVGGATIAFALLVTAAALGWTFDESVIKIVQIWTVLGFTAAWWATR
jgi:hypothetical protein